MVVLAYSWRSMVCIMGKEHGQNRGPTEGLENDEEELEDLWVVD